MPDIRLRPAGLPGDVTLVPGERTLVDVRLGVPGSPAVLGVGTLWHAPVAVAGGGGAVLTGSVTAAAVVNSAALTTAILCTGSAAATATVAGSLTTSILLTGSVTAVATVAATELKGAAAVLTGTLAGQSAVNDAALTTSILLTGTLAGQSAGQGALTTAILCTGSVTAAATVNNAALTTSIRLTGAVGCVATVNDATLTTTIRLTGDVTAILTVNDADLTTGGGTAAALMGGITAVSSVAGALSTAIRLTGSVGCVASVAGTLTMPAAGKADIFFPRPVLDSRGQPVYAASMYADMVKRYGLFEGERIYYAMAREKKGPFGEEKKYADRRPVEHSYPVKPQRSGPLEVDRTTAAVPAVPPRLAPPPLYLPKIRKPRS